jgi:hypothetical protein
VSDEGRDPRERARNLMMAALDDELSSDEKAELDRMLEGDAALRVEWSRLQRVKEVTASMSYREPPEEIWDSYWTSAYNRIERGLGWLLFWFGALVLIGWGTWFAVQELLADSEIPGFFKTAIFALVLGLIILGLSVVREKWFTRRRDPYKEIQR